LNTGCQRLLNEWTSDARMKGEYGHSADVLDIREDLPTDRQEIAQPWLGDVADQGGAHAGKLAVDSGRHRLHSRSHAEGHESNHQRVLNQILAIFLGQQLQEPLCNFEHGVPFLYVHRLKVSQRYQPDVGEHIPQWSPQGHFLILNQGGFVLFARALVPSSLLRR
jgi:hypothetical protein